MSTLSDRINARIDPALKKRAHAVFARLGLSEAEAIRMFYAQVSLRQGIPFDITIPNAETLAAFEETKNPDALKSYQSFDDLLEAIDR